MLQQEAVHKRAVRASVTNNTRQVYSMKLNASAMLVFPCTGKIITEATTDLTRKSAMEDNFIRPTPKVARGKKQIRKHLII